MSVLVNFQHTHEDEPFATQVSVMTLPRVGDRVNISKWLESEEDPDGSEDLGNYLVSEVKFSIRLFNRGGTEAHEESRPLVNLKRLR